ncbi:hypothetical protein WG66_001656 [Moniliophthora roreri]|nr:hypothetical protein WG66_001656 [Moniliophthora roreri]
MPVSSPFRFRRRHRVGLPNINITNIHQQAPLDIKPPSSHALCPAIPVSLSGIIAGMPAENCIPLRADWYLGDMVNLHPNITADGPKGLNSGVNFTKVCEQFFMTVTLAMPRIGVDLDLGGSPGHARHSCDDRVYIPRRSATSHSDTGWAFVLTIGIYK